MKPFAIWLLTFLGFPLGGLLAVQTIGSIGSAVAGAAAGALAGAVIGGAQWLALRERGIGVRWVAYTAAAMSAGTGLAVAIFGAGTEMGDLVVRGAITGLAIGAAQATTLGRGPGKAALWTAVVGAAWALGWAITTSAGIDVERSYAVFGASGALTATVLTGLVLQFVLRGEGVRPVRPSVAVEPAVS